MKKQTLLIVNPCSGKKRTRKNTQDVIRILSDDGCTVTVKETACKGHATQLAEKNGGDYDLIACCGGDGTFNEVMNAISVLLITDIFSVRYPLALVLRHPSQQNSL